MPVERKVNSGKEARKGSEVRGALGQCGVLESSWLLVVATALVLASGKALVLGVGLTLACCALVQSTVVWSHLGSSGGVKAVLEARVQQRVLFDEALVDFVSKVTVMLQLEHLWSQNAEELRQLWFLCH